MNRIPKSILARSILALGLAGLVAAVPVWRLGFARDPGVWRTIAEAV